MFACTASVQTYLAYLNYKASPLDNISYRIEFYDDKQGQRTGVKTRYVETGIGWQHWFSPQIEIRPEVSTTSRLMPNAFNGNSNLGIAPTKNFALIGSADIIIHFDRRARRRQCPPGASSEQGTGEQHEANSSHIRSARDAAGCRLAGARRRPSDVHQGARGRGAGI